MIFANRPQSLEHSDGARSESVNVCFEHGEKTLSLALDNSCGRMEKLGRSDIRLLIGNEDVTSKVFDCGDDDIVHASIENFAKATRWLNRVEWGMEGCTGCTQSRAEVE